MPIAHGIHIGAKTQPQFISGQVVSFRATKNTVSHKRMIVAILDFFIILEKIVKGIYFIEDFGKAFSVVFVTKCVPQAGFSA